MIMCINNASLGIKNCCLVYFTHCTQCLRPCPSRRRPR